MQELTRAKQGELCYTISATNIPRLSIRSGETVRVETEDAFSGQVRKDADRRDPSAVPYANPLSGPIFVEDASPGDTLAIKIEDIHPLIGQGATRFVSPWYPSKSDTEVFQRFMGTGGAPHGTSVCQIRDGLVQYDGFTIPFRPMLGVVATADPMETYLSWFPGPHGGNMDCPQVTVGATLYLPVRVPGALLHLGDAHAAQGDGELSGAAVEMPAVTTMTVDVLKDGGIDWPRVETEEHVFVITGTAAGRSMEGAIRLAFTELILWLEKDYGLERWRSFGLLTFVAKIQVCNLWTVAVGIPKRYLSR